MFTEFVHKPYQIEFQELNVCIFNKHYEAQLNLTKKEFTIHKARSKGNQAYEKYLPLESELSFLYDATEEFDTMNWIISIDSL
ncbi:hypothetical protein AHA02nite_25100 [Alkalibacillus haloalkaliphilus]|uniref:Uncharacterized protein n=1 Tax=Alkalibacillus haloalkaliphilus TaxID=94136 RepID=A0A511W6L1_9BACI|nr:hypothetical protein AHA02nite_25100 [Alkalibacillus haloalkaliphilus]